MGTSSRFVVCFATRDGVRADLHAYADGDGEIDKEDYPRITCQWCGRKWGESETFCPECGEKREAYGNENAKEAK